MSCVSTKWIQKDGDLWLPTVSESWTSNNRTGFSNYWATICPIFCSI